MAFSPNDILFEDFPLSSFNLAVKANVNIDDFLLDNSIFKPRDKNEDWNTYYPREQLAIKKLKKIIFSVFGDKEFNFQHNTDEYSENLSEFNFIAGGAILTLDIHGDGSCLYYRTAECFDEGNIVGIFDDFEPFKLKLRNTINYVETIARENNGKVLVQFWLSRTGLSGRTKHLEQLTLGTNLGFKKSYELGYELFDSSGNNIGDITFGNDRTPEGSHDDNEYFKIYKDLEKEGVISLVNITLDELVKHGSKTGRPRKALAKVLLEFNVDFEKLELHKSNIVVDYKTIADNMATLSMIDYNRKCSIIKGELIPSYKYEDLFPISSTINTDDYEFLLDEQLEFVSISKFAFSLDELISFWNVFCPLRCCQKNNNPEGQKDLNLYREDDYFIYHLHTEPKGIYRIKKLGIYRKSI